MNTFLEGLTEEGAKAVLQLVLVGVLGLVAAVLARNLARRGKVWVGPSAGRTCMSPYVLLVGLLCAVAAVVFLGVGVYFREALRQPGEFYAWVGLVGLCSLLSLAILPFTRHTWEWDATGLRWRGAWKSVAMRWPDLERIGKSWDGQLYVVDRAGRKISWSEHTLEHEALLRAVQTARPELALPA